MPAAGVDAYGGGGGALSDSLSHAHWVAWRANARRTGRRWRSYVALVAVAAAYSSVLAVLPGIPLRQGMVGVVLGGVVMTIALSSAGFDDPIMRGAVAERWTEEALAKRSWPVVSNLMFPDGDIDHLAVTPCGVLAIETKYRYHQSDQRRLAAQRYRDLAAAQRAARKARSLLRSHDFQHHGTVIPVLVVWGPGSPELPTGYKLVDEVYVVDGDHPSLWAHLFSAPLLTRTDRDDLAAALTAFQCRQVTHLANHRRHSLRRACWEEFRAGVRESHAARATASARRRAVRRRHEAVT